MRDADLGTDSRKKWSSITNGCVEAVSSVGQHACVMIDMNAGKTEASHDEDFLGDEFHVKECRQFAKSVQSHSSQ
jgi:hypothetical protein